MKNFIITLLCGVFLIFPNKTQSQEKDDFDYIILSNDSLKQTQTLPLIYVNKPSSLHEKFKILRPTYGINFNSSSWSFELGLLNSNDAGWMGGFNFAFGEDYSEEMKVKTIKLSVAARSPGILFLGADYGGKFMIIPNGVKNVSPRSGFYPFLSGEVGYRISEDAFGFGELNICLRTEISDPSYLKNNFIVLLVLDFFCFCL